MSIEVEEYEPYECIICGRTDIEDEDSENGGIVFPSEVYLCSNCRKLF